MYIDLAHTNFNKHILIHFNSLDPPKFPNFWHLQIFGNLRIFGNLPIFAIFGSIFVFILPCFNILANPVCVYMFEKVTCLF